MKVIERGHVYQLHHIDGSNASLLVFVNREVGTEHEGTQTQEVLRAYIDKAKLDLHQVTEGMTALINRTQHCDSCLRWEGNDKIVAHLAHAIQGYDDAIKAMRMALVLHEARALERKTEKGELEPESVETDRDGHYVLSTPEKAAAPEMTHEQLAELNQLTSCDFTQGCTDPTCPKCYGGEGTGVFLIKSKMGYSVLVDKEALPMDVSWSEADRIAKAIAKSRRPGDGRGYARCRHPGNEKCFEVWHHIDAAVRGQGREIGESSSTANPQAAREPQHLDEPSTTDYCKVCGESPESAVHVGLGRVPKAHEYVDPRVT